MHSANDHNENKRVDLRKVGLEQRRGGAVEAFDGCSVLARSRELVANLSSKHFAEFDTPLIKAVDAPNSALHDRAMFVEGKELATAEGVQMAFKQEGH